MNSVDRITDHPDTTSAVYRGRKASTQTKNMLNYFSVYFRLVFFGTATRLDYGRLRQRMSSRFNFAPVRACDQYIAAIFLKQKRTIYVF